MVCKKKKKKRKKNQTGYSVRFNVRLEYGTFPPPNTWSTVDLQRWKTFIIRSLGNALCSNLLRSYASIDAECGYSKSNCRLRVASFYRSHSLSQRCSVGLCSPSHSDDIKSKKQIPLLFGWRFAPFVSELKALLEYQVKLHVQLSARLSYWTILHKLICAHSLIDLQPHWQSSLFFHTICSFFVYFVQKEQWMACKAWFQNYCCGLRFVKPAAQYTPQAPAYVNLSSACEAKAKSVRSRVSVCYDSSYALKMC